jgi:hypothetical protein
MEEKPFNFDDEPKLDYGSVLSHQDKSSFKSG